MPLKFATDPRIKSVQFIQDVPIKFIAYYGIQTVVSFPEGEKIEKILLSDPAAWGVKTIYNNKLSIKAIEDNPTTNMVIITNQRTYHFVLYAQKTNNLNDENITFELKINLNNNKNNITNAVPIINEYTKNKFNLNYQFHNIAKKKHLAQNILNFFDDNQSTYITLSKYSSFPVVLAKKAGRNYYEKINWSVSEDNSSIIIPNIYSYYKLIFDKNEFLIIYKKNTLNI